MMVGPDRNLNTNQYSINSIFIDDPTKPEKSIHSLTNHYIGELQSLTDQNSVTVIFIENGFQDITSSLLSSYLVVSIRGKRYFSSNLEIFLQVEIERKNVSVIGRLVPGFTYKDIVPVEMGKTKDLGPNEQSTYFTNLSTLSSEVIQRNRIYVYGRIVDINFIKFEFVCDLCNGGTLLSIAKCINYCLNPRPVLKLFMRCTI